VSGNEYSVKPRHNVACISSTNNMNRVKMPDICADILEKKEGGGQTPAVPYDDLITLPLVPAQIFMFSDLFSLGFLEEVAMFGFELDH